MLSSFSYYSSCPRFEIYEYVEKNGTMELDKLGNYRDTCYRMFFPPVITPMENGKFIFSPQETMRIPRQNWSFDPIEVWEKNETLTRSTLELPINFPREIYSLWIVQL